MSGPEQSVVNATIRVLDDARALHFNLSARNGETGLCDRLAIYKGRVLWIEVKRRGGGRLSARQAWQLARAREAGAVALVVTDPRQVRDALDLIDASERAK